MLCCDKNYASPKTQKCLFLLLCLVPTLDFKMEDTFH